MTHAWDIILLAVVLWVVGRLLINYHYYRKRRHTQSLLNELADNKGECNGQ